jgi:hypothetical protein
VLLQQKRLKRIKTQKSVDISHDQATPRSIALESDASSTGESPLEQQVQLLTQQVADLQTSNKQLLEMCATILDRLPPV